MTLRKRTAMSGVLDLGCHHLAPQRPLLRRSTHPAADLDQILRRAAGPRPHRTGNRGTSSSLPIASNCASWSKVCRGAGHVAESAATIVVIGPAADNEFHRAQLDLGQATMAMTLAAVDLGIGSSTRASPTCSSPAICSASPRTATGPCSSRSATQPTGR